MANTIWDVRTTGNDANGGGFACGGTGTDFSQQSAAQIAYTDLVIGPAASQLTSAAHPFTAAHVGNVINITGGVGFTAGRYQVVTVAGGTASMSSAVGTIGSTNGTGNLGGSLATVAGVLVAGLLSTGDSVYFKSGTYTFTTRSSITVQSYWYGYNATHGDNGTRPLFTTSVNSIDFAYVKIAGMLFSNMNFSSTAGTPGRCFIANSTNILNFMLVNVSISGFLYGVDGSNGADEWIFLFAIYVGVEIKNCTQYGIIGTNSGAQDQAYFDSCWFHDNTLSGVHKIGTVNCYNSIFSNNGGAGYDDTHGGVMKSFSHCAFYKNSLPQAVFNQVTVNVGSGPVVFNSCIFWGVNSTTDVAISGFGTPTDTIQNPGGYNAYGNFANPSPTLSFIDTFQKVTLTADPFTNAAAGDFSLNSAAGGGALCKGTGWPGVFPGGLSTGHLDIGPIQSAAGGGATVVPPVSYFG